jgi:hypothetical protein
MEMGWLMIAVVHANDDPQEASDDRHDPTDLPDR